MGTETIATAPLSGSCLIREGRQAYGGYHSHTRHYFFGRAKRAFPCDSDRSPSPQSDPPRWMVLSI